MPTVKTYRKLNSTVYFVYMCWTGPVFVLILYCYNYSEVALELMSTWLW